jgi:hypothetical protein
MDIASILKGEHTKQEIFDHVLGKLREQGGPSAVIVEKVEVGEEKVQCLYRGPNNRACAAGLLFTDEQMQVVSENSPFLGICEEKGFYEHLFPDATEDDRFRIKLESCPFRLLISDMQKAHDSAARTGWEDPDNGLEARFNHAARLNDVNYTEASE